MEIWTRVNAGERGFFVVASVYRRPNFKVSRRRQGFRRFA